MPAFVEGAIKTDGPADAAFFKGKFQRGEAARDAAEKERFADTVGSGGEVADLVVHEIGNGDAHAPVEAEGMEGRRQLELDAFGPDGIVIVFAIEAEIVHPG